MNFNYPVFIQPGFTKTANTTLDKQLYQKHSEIISVKYSDELELIQLAIEGINYNKLILQRMLEDNINRQINDKKKCIIWPEHRMTMEPHLQGKMVERLKQIFPDAKIFFVIRNQIDSVRSLYSSRAFQLGAVNPTATFTVPSKFHSIHVTFEEWIEFEFNNVVFSYLGVIDYDRIISNYENVFGNNNVHVFLFEEFVNEQEVFISNLSSMLGINREESIKLIKNKHENISYADIGLAYHKFHRRFFPEQSFRDKIFLKLKSIFPKELINKLRNSLYYGKKSDAYISDYWRERIISNYKIRNSKLNQRYKLKMEKYNYPL